MGCGQYIDRVSAALPPTSLTEPTAPRRSAAHSTAVPATSAWTRLREALPGQCEFCRRWDRGRFCAACLARHAAPRPRCARCAAPLGLAAPACGACLAAPPPFVRTGCAVDYAFPWDRALHAFKFAAQPELAWPLAALLTRALADADALAHPAPDTASAAAELVLPVPLSAPRLAARGYNQAWELARHVARARGLPARAEVLTRPLDTPAQSALDRAERQRNLRGAFWVPPGYAPVIAGRRVALVDDVVTTGATAAEATATLLRAGAAAVEVWALARTP
jgi:ComF family protein